MSVIDGRVKPRVSISATDEDVVTKAAELMGCPSVRSRAPSIDNSYERQRQYRAEIGGRVAISLMMELYPLLGARRKSRIVEILKAYNAYISSRTEEAMTDKAITLAVQNSTGS